MRNKTKHKNILHYHALLRIAHERTKDINERATLHKYYINTLSLPSYTSVSVLQLERYAYCTSLQNSLIPVSRKRYVNSNE